MAESIQMPALGETSDELHIVKWLKSEGDAIALGEPLLLVETDKAEMEVESVAEGTVLKILVAEGQDVEASTVIAYVGAPGEEVPSS